MGRLKLSECGETELQYMEMWRHSERWTDLNVMLDRAELLLAAEHLVSAGAINSQMCFPEAKNVEQRIEWLSAQFRSLPKAEQDKIFKRCFSGCKTFTCADCGYISFVTDGNETLYETELKHCWECGSGNVEQGTVNEGDENEF